MFRKIEYFITGDKGNRQSGNEPQLFEAAGTGRPYVIAVYEDQLSGKDLIPSEARAVFASPDLLSQLRPGYRVWDAQTLRAVAQPAQAVIVDR